MADRQYPGTSTVVNPLAVRWDDGRDTRGNPPGRMRLARCSAYPSCPWRWRTGDQDRPCPWHRYEADWDELESRARSAGIELRPGTRLDG
jgi:hypothetical protein